MAGACREPGASAPQATPTVAPHAAPLRTGSAQPPASASANPPSAQVTTATGPGWTARPYAIRIADRGVFGDLDSQVRLRLPSWLSGSPAVLLRARGHEVHFAYVAHGPVGLGTGAMGPEVGQANAADPNDADGDSIPDALDIVMGAKKAVRNAAAYRNTYRVLPYPNGDVPRTEGVCTDVVVRALRNAGLDLQQLVHEDILAAPRDYPMVQRPDRNIDHRRVRTLLPYFRRHWRTLSTDLRDGREPLLPGDICFLDTLPGPGPEHLGIVSDRVGRSGLPLIINNWTDGYRTSEMDLLAFVPVTHRFRIPTKPLPVAAEHRGVAGLLGRHRIRLPAVHRQLVLVHAPLWTSSAATLTRLLRDPAEGGWRQVETPVAVRLGAAGMGRGRGLHDRMAGAIRPGPTKREGDRRSPAGVFELDTAFGPGSRARPMPSRWPWRSVNARDRWVDDPKSPHYNSWQRAGVRGEPEPWDSAERLGVYSLGVVVRHNTDPVQPGAGSAIFLHVWSGSEQTTSGCTAMPRDALLGLIKWLDPEAHPVLVQLPGMLL